MARTPGLGATDVYVIETARARGITDFITFDILWEFIDDITLWTLPDNQLVKPLPWSVCNSTKCRW